MRHYQYILTVVAGLAIGIAFLVIFSLFVIAPYQSQVFDSEVTRDNPYEIDTRIVFAHAYSGISCPMLPCDTSGFVLMLTSKHEVMILGYEVCNIGSTCLYNAEVQIYLLGTPSGINDESD